MRIGIFVNDLATEQSNYTSTCLALEALKRGHEAWYISAADFAYGVDDRLHAHACAGAKRKYESNESYLKDLQGPKARAETICVHSDTPAAHDVARVLRDTLLAEGLIEPVGAR